MEDINFSYVKSRINQEGFDYCFIHYSEFFELKDKKFHKLRLNYIKSQQELKKYVIEQAKIESNEL